MKIMGRNWQSFGWSCDRKFGYIRRFISSSNSCGGVSVCVSLQKRNLNSLNNLSGLLQWPNCTVLSRSGNEEQWGLCATKQSWISNLLLCFPKQNWSMQPHPSLYHSVSTSLKHSKIQSYLSAFKMKQIEHRFRAFSQCHDCIIISCCSNTARAPNVSSGFPSDGLIKVKIHPKSGCHFCSRAWSSGVKHLADVWLACSTSPAIQSGSGQLPPWNM